MESKNSHITRRRFIHTSLSGLAAAGLAGVSPSLASAQEEGESGKQQKSESTANVIYREFGKTGIKVPIVSMGAGGTNNPEMIRAAYETGMRHFDTASNYAFGRNEQMVGKVLHDLDVRDKVVIGSKQLRPTRPENMSAAQMKEKFIKLTEGSLKRLKTDYIDIMYIHDVRSADALENDGSFDALDQLKKDGKIRAAGVSTHESMAEVINKAAGFGVFDVILTSFNVSMADDEDLIKAIDGASAKGIGFVAMKTLAGGRLLPNQTALSQYDSAAVNIAMLKWVLRHESITTAIPGFNNLEHMEQDFSVAGNLEYTEEEKRFLADNDLKVGLGFCRQCRVCVASCPHGVEIPTLMRTHMYAAQYSDFRLARAALDEIPPRKGLATCRACERCTAECANSVDIAYRIGDLRLIYG
jgi:predicted aldo/keto reductase-like oxidoreductase